MENSYSALDKLTLKFQWLSKQKIITHLHYMSYISNNGMCVWVRQVVCLNFTALWKYQMYSCIVSTLTYLVAMEERKHGKYLIIFHSPKMLIIIISPYFIDQGNFWTILICKWQEKSIVFLVTKENINGLW